MRVLGHLRALSAAWLCLFGKDAPAQTEGGTLALDLCTHTVDVLSGLLGQAEWVCLECVGVCAQI